MAHTKSALKRLRQTQTRTARNRAANSKVRTLRKKVTAGDLESYKAFVSAVDKAAKTGKLPKNRAANYKSKAAKTLATQ